MLINKALVIRLSSIGDIILASPLIRAFHKRFPNAQIDFAVKIEFAELLLHHPFLTTIHRIDTRTGFSGLRKIKQSIKSVGYDLVIDIHDNFRSKYLRSRLGTEVASVNKRKLEGFLLTKFKVHTYKGIIPVAERYLETAKKFTVIDDGEGLEVFVAQDTRARVIDKLKNLGIENSFSVDRNKVIGFCPNAKHNTKMWPREYFMQLGRLLQEKHGARIFLFGGTSDVQHCREVLLGLNGQAVNLAGELSIMETAAAMDVCDVIVTNDTGLMHLAAARRRKIVAIFGPTVQEFGFFPYRANSIVLEKRDLKCRPCSHIGTAECPKKHFRCMIDIRVADALSSVERLLDN
jgi:heptosyltransferase-2